MVGHWHYVNVTCTVLNNEAHATSASGHHPIAILCDEEKYSQLKEHLVDIEQDVASFTSLVIDDVEYTIRYHLSGDYKFLLTKLNLNPSEIPNPLDLAHFWESMSHRYPNLARIAMDAMLMPVSSVDVERPE